MSVHGRRKEDKRKYSSFHIADYKKRKMKESCSAVLDKKRISKNNCLETQFQPQFMNYQLIGDKISCMILYSEKEMYDIDTIFFQNYIHSSWDSQDLLSKLMSKEINYPIAKKIILSVGYNDVIKREITPEKIVENIREIVNELRRKGCIDIIITNIPPCACLAPLLDHWRYLQVINDSLQLMYKKSEDVIICNIFKLFCKPKNLNEKDKYILYGVINYDISNFLYNKYSHKNNLDLFTFNIQGRIEMSRYLKHFLNYRINHYLVFDHVQSKTDDSKNHNAIPNTSNDNDDVILIDDESDNESDDLEKKSNLDIIKIDDSESDNDFDVLPSVNVLDRSISIINKESSSIPINDNNDNDIILVKKESFSNSENSSIKSTDENELHPFGCKCKHCKAIDRKLIIGFLSTISEEKNSES